AVDLIVSLLVFSFILLVFVCLFFSLALGVCATAKLQQFASSCCLWCSSLSFISCVNDCVACCACSCMSALVGSGACGVWLVCAHSVVRLPAVLCVVREPCVCVCAYLCCLVACSPAYWGVRCVWGGVDL